MGSKPVVHRKAWRVLAGRIAAGSLCALLAGACSRDASSAAPAGAGVKPGTYRAVLQIPAGELPLGAALTGDYWSGTSYHIDQLLAET
jgi:hypothetical protein